MDSTLYGQITGPVVTIIGVWEPFLAEHERLLKQMADYARMSGLASLAVTLDPAPSSLVFGPTPWPECNDTQTRLRLLERCGLDGILLVHFTETDLACEAADLFRLLFALTQVSELWLGLGQSFGRGPTGSPEAIAQLAAHYHIRLKELPFTDTALHGRKIRRHLAAGRLIEVSQIVGRPPIRSRPTSGSMRVAWLPGRYQAIALADSSGPISGPLLDLELVDEGDGYVLLDWPREDIEYLAFIAGPADLAGTHVTLVPEAIISSELA